MKSTILKLIAIAAVFALLVGTATAATTFAVSDFTTNNPYFSADLSVDENDAPFGRVSVALVPEEKEGLDTTGYSITESAAGPGDWDTMLPVEYLFSAMPAPGEIQLHAWVRYEDSGVPSYEGPFSDWIVYSTETSQPYSIVITPGAYSIDLSWDTDEAAIGWVEYREVGSGTWLLSEPGLYGLQTVITITGLTEETDYELVLHSNTVVVDEIDEEPIVVTTIQAQGVETDVTWSGALAPDDLRWSRGPNWQDMFPPANPTPATVQFLAAGVSTSSGTITAVVDPQNLPGEGDANVWSVANLLLHFDSNTYHSWSMVDEVTQTGKTLMIENNLSIMRGVLRPVGGSIGFDPSATIMLGQNTPSSDKRIGQLTLSDTTVVDNILHVNEIKLGTYGNYWGSDGRIVISESTGLQKIQVDSLLAMGAMFEGNQVGLGYIGIPGTGIDWWLPANIDIQIGTATSQADVEVGTRCRSIARAGVLGVLRASSGGILTLNVDQMLIASNNVLTDNGPAQGYLDFENMTECSGSIETLRLCMNDTTSVRNVTARLSLPEGTVQMGSVRVSNYITTGINQATLRLNGTTVPITQSIRVDANGVVETILNGKSAGLDIPAGATMNFDNGGALHFHIAAEQDTGETGEYRALRWEGPDRRTFLQAMEDDGKLTYTIADGVTGSIGYAYDDTYTYVAFREVWAPTIITKDITIEVQSEDPIQVVIHAKDIDDLAGVTTVTREITHPNDLDTDSETVTLTVTPTPPNEYELTLTLEPIGGGPQATDTATMTVILVPDGTGDDLTWTGEASLLTVMGPDRPEWLWGQNWTGGLPPANPTNATLTFANMGTGTSKLDENRTVRYIDFNNRLLEQTIDLNGNTLIIAGEDETENPLAGRIRFTHDSYTATAEFTNGTLQIGTPDVRSDILLSSGAARTSVLKISSDLQLYAGTVRICGNSNNTDILDLRDATLVDGIFRANNLLVGGGGSNEDARVMLSETMNLQEVAVTGEFLIGYGTYSRGRIGVPDEEDPNADWKLPAGVDVTLGVDGVSRGSLWVGRSGYGWNRGYLGGAVGGEFNAYLSFLRVGTTRDQGSPVGTLDLREMASCNIDTSEISIGSYVPPNPPHANRAIDARVYLTTGTVSTGVLRLDDEVVSSETSLSLLELNDTLLTVGTSLTMGPNSQIDINVGSAPSGLDILEHTDPEQVVPITIADGGVISIFFNEEPSGTELHWGMRLAGDRVDELEALAAADKLVWDDTGMTPDAAIFFQDGYTYVGVQGVCITEFAVTGDTGSSLFTRTAEVDVVLNAVSYVGTVNGWQITETDDEPETWLGASPTAYEIQTEPGMIELFGWVKDDEGNVARTSTSILYEPTNVVISNVVMTDNEDGTVSITWDTNVAAFGKIDYKLYWDPEWIATAFVGPVTSHSAVMVLQGLVDEQHDIIITSNATTLETQWPVVVAEYPEGDANEDCMVDLRDLVFVRNRLFETVTPANETADVNGDDSIDLEDLIVVRNNLGAVCEQPE